MNWILKGFATGNKFFFFIPDLRNIAAFCNYLAYIRIVALCYKNVVIKTDASAWSSSQISRTGKMI
jgi:hypothetical protein